MHITLRDQQIEDAKRFYEILSNPNFTYFQTGIENEDEEREYLLYSEERKIQNIEHNFTIMIDNVIVGGCGIKIRQHRLHIGEIGYFVDEKYWGKGIATLAVKELGKKGFSELGLIRIEVWMQPGNIGSEKVALKNGYLKEGLMKKCVHNRVTKEYKDAYLYAKTKD